MEEFKGGIIIGDGFVEFGKQQGAPQRGFEGSNQQSVVGAAAMSADGAAGVAANAVGDEPFALMIDWVAANFASELQGGGEGHGWGLLVGGYCVLGVADCVLGIAYCVLRISYFVLR